MQLDLRLSAAACLVALTLFACGGGGGGGGDSGSSGGSSSGTLPVTGTGPGTPTPVTPTPAPGAPASDLCAGLPAESGSLASRLANAPISRSGSGNYRQATAAEQATFQSAFQSALRGELVALATFKDVGFKTSCYTDGGGTRWLVIEDATSGRAGGRFAINLAPARDLWFEAPHPDSDENTEYMAADLSAQLGARAVVVSGSHRCTSNQATTCSGHTSPCGDIKVSDVAHDMENFFTAAHKALRTSFASATAVSVHGMTPLNGEAAVISDGTDLKRAGSISAKVRDAINGELRSTSRAMSCNDVADSNYRKVCGVTNVQGRFDNGSTNACTVDAPRASDRFVHLEQSAALRGTATQPGVGPEAVTKGFAAVVPCSLGGSGLGCGTVASR